MVPEHPSFLKEDIAQRRHYILQTEKKQKNINLNCIRICAEIKIKNRKINCISTYAPTEEETEKHPNKTEKEEYKDVVGKYTRSNINRNGEMLLEFCKLHNLHLTNTFKKHKPSQLTSWESPLHPQKDRKNPYRYQIDYIIMRKQKNLEMIDSRSYCNTLTKSDHKPYHNEHEIYIL